MSILNLWARLLIGLVAVAAVVVAPPTTAQSSNLRGVVRDSSSGEPIVGAVVQAIDRAGVAKARSLTTRSGAFQISADAGVQRLQVLRLGFRPTVFSLSERDASTPIELRMAPIARALATVDVAAAPGCPSRGDRTDALVLLEQARAGLLAAAAGTDRPPATLRVLRYDRRLDINGTDIVSQVVREDTSRAASVSFASTRSAGELVRQGFRDGRDGAYTYFGADADVLLDPQFQRGYCVSLAAAPRADDGASRGLMGLHFVPANRRAGRIDIDGTLWIDTAQRELRSWTFRYVGVEPLAADLQVGGNIRFRTLANGVPFIEAWTLRLVGAADTVETDAGLSVQRYAVLESGGVLASAQWSEGERWEAPLGSVVINATTEQGAPAPHVELMLRDSPFRSRTDSAGRAVFTSVLDGPYAVQVDEPRLRPIGIPIDTDREVMARPGVTTARTFAVPTAEGMVSGGCGILDMRADRAWTIGRLVTPRGRAAVGVQWKLRVLDDGAWRVVSERGVTGSSGLVFVCRGVAIGQTLELTAWRDPNRTARMTLTTRERINAARLVVPEPPLVADARRDQSAVLIGTVRDSVSGVAIANARVRLVDLPLEGATDSTGTFLIGGLPHGRHVLEITTPWLDSIGAAARAALTIADSAAPVSVFTPALSELLDATCGEVGSTGVIVGRLVSPTFVAWPPGLRVIGEWPATTEAALREGVRRSRGKIDASGIFRLCGVPIDSLVTVRLETDSIIPMGARPTSVRVSASRRFARVDLPVDTTLVTLPVQGGITTEARTSLPTVNISASGAPVGFEERRRLGIGKFLTAADLEPMGGRRLSDALSMRSGFTAVQGRGDHGYVVSRRTPRHITPRGTGGVDTEERAVECGLNRATVCVFSVDDFREQGFYCPTNAEVARGIECGCYAQVYVDDQLQNNSRPTEPFDINRVLTSEIAGIEFYATPAQTPGRYSQLNAKCGVLLIWTKRSPS